MCHRKWTCKNGTSFTVLSLAVTEEQGVGSGIIMTQFARLPHKTTAQHGSVVYFRTRRYDEIIAYNTVTYIYWSCDVAVYATVCKAACSADFGIIANTYILDRTGI